MGHAKYLDKKCPPVVRRSYGRRGGFYLCEDSADCYTCQLILNHSGAQALPCSKHEISGFDSRDSAASESLRSRGVMTSPGGRVSGSDVALSGASVPSGSRALAGNAGVAALRPGVAVETGSGVSTGSGAGVTGLGADVAARAGAGTVATASPAVGVCSPQASRAAKINRTIHRGQLQHPRSPFFPPRPAGPRNPYS